ncbi:hypothetical protein [Vibrio barjaei]|uniref:hypothetical protein n=1 Tax=Vibrio barjaei TaxID=1676683 RepID=UPI002283C8CB|nr:hypothetical protein [Vibrio barjaei]MCY9874513.1 hypothetical protein [Vibrio barjaei]
MNKATKGITINGHLEMFFETGMEGVRWMIDSKTELKGLDSLYDTLYHLEEGDHLTVYSHDGDVLFDGPILEDNLSHHVSSSSNLPSRQSVCGIYCHWVQQGHPEDEWLGYFTESFPATVTKYVHSSESILNFKADKPSAFEQSSLFERLFSFNRVHQSTTTLIGDFAPSIDDDLESVNMATVDNFISAHSRIMGSFFQNYILITADEPITKRLTKHHHTPPTNEELSDYMNIHAFSPVSMQEISDKESWSPVDTAIMSEEKRDKLHNKARHQTRLQLSSYLESSKWFMTKHHGSKVYCCLVTIK